MAYRETAGRISLISPDPSVETFPLKHFRLTW